MDCRPCRQTVPISSCSSTARGRCRRSNNGWTTHPIRGLGAGIIDIRTHYCETPDDVAERVRTCLRHVPADKLFLTTDCGLRYVHRTLAREKITNLVAGVRIVRDEM